MFPLSKLNIISKALFRINFFLILVVIIYYLAFQNYFPSWLFFVKHDIKVYWASSDWVLGNGSLYGDVPSEYPLFANIIFAICRVASLPFKNLFGDLNSFAFIWFLMGLSSLLFTLKSIKQFINKDIALKAAWLSPAILLFSGSRFDIYPVLFFVLSLINLKKDRLFISAIYLGISICLKGYAIFILPSCFYYISVNFGIKKSIYFILLVLSLFGFSNLSILFFLGKDALLFPYKYHALRTFNGQSTWDALQLKWLINYLPALPSVSAIFFSLIGFLRKPRNFDEFADSCVLATTGFSSSLVFYSPQFCLWTLSCSTFSKNRKITFLTLCFCFTTYIYYPLAGVYYAYGTRNDTYSFFIYSASIILVTITRILLIFFTIVKSKKNKSFKYKF